MPSGQVTINFGTIIVVYYSVMKKIWELKIYWEDGCTIECRYFTSKKKAREYADDNGVVDYVIVPCTDYSVKIY